MVEENGQLAIGSEDAGFHMDSFASGTVDVSGQKRTTWALELPVLGRAGDDVHSLDGNRVNKVRLQLPVIATAPCCLISRGQWSPMRAKTKCTPTAANVIQMNSSACDLVKGSFGDGALTHSEAN